MNIADQLVHTTTRVECQDAAGGISSGTGFFMNVGLDELNMHVPVLVTNKHVIKGALYGNFHLNVCDAQGQFLAGKHISFPIKNFENAWFPHPDPAVDLAVLPIAPFLEDVARRTQGLRAFTRPIERNALALADFSMELSAIEDVVMVGYPNGLWDSTNNMPILRRGVTATAPYLDFEGRKEIVIDCACFPGSSGSPVFLYNRGFYTAKNGDTYSGGRVRLLGVLWGGPQHTATGTIRVMPVPTNNVPLAISNIPNNLGYIIKAEQLLVFESMFAQIIEAQADIVVQDPSGSQTSPQ